MGIEGYLLSSTLLGVLAQRLARKLCPHCKAEVKLEEKYLKEANLDPNLTYYSAVGCSECDFTGYKGRQAVGELFIIDDDVKRMMHKGMNDHEIRDEMKLRGMLTISDRLKAMLIEGLTSYEEAVRVGLMDG